MKTTVAKSVLGALAGASLFLAAGAAFAAKPVGLDISACGVTTPFEATCVANHAVAFDLLGDAAYTGSCSTDGGACAQSVYNKLLSAASKWTAGKQADACANLASIQADLTTWLTAAKPKINQGGFDAINAPLTTSLQASGCVLP